MNFFINRQIGRLMDGQTDASASYKFDFSSNKSSPPRLHINWQSGSTTPSSHLHQATPTTMDADTLRAILSAQAAAQDKMLQAVMKDMRGMFSSMTSTSTTAHATSAEFVTNSLSARLPEFTHDSENGCTFDVWYSRYEDIITQDGATLDEAAKARLIVSKLDAPAYAHFTNHILPRKAAEISLAETVKTLQKLFGHNTSVFARRYAYLKTQCNGESLRDYTGLVNRRHEMAEFNAITAEQMKCLVWNCGLAALEYADIRTHALRKLESNPETTLRELSAEIQQLLDIRQDAKLMCSPPSQAAPPFEIDAVEAKKSQNKEPPSAMLPLWRTPLGEGMRLHRKTLSRMQPSRTQEGILQEF
ncbi:hypothetical protein V3C99_000366 [Haemonchus contortus]